MTYRTVRCPRCQHVVEVRADSRTLRWHQGTSGECSAGGRLFVGNEPSVAEYSSPAFTWSEVPPTHAREGYAHGDAR